MFDSLLENVFLFSRRKPSGNGCVISGILHATIPVKKTSECCFTIIGKWICSVRAIDSHGENEFYP